MTTNTQPPASPAPMRAGGRATESGMAFQAEVATWFAVHILVRMPVGGRFGINNEALPTAIRLETGDDLDDIEVSQADGGELHIQCKTSATLSKAKTSPLGKTIKQLVHWISGKKLAGDVPDTTRSVALLTVRDDAPQTLNTLNTCSSAFKHGGSWIETYSQRNKAEQRALELFESLATQEWTTLRGNAPNNEDLVDLVRIFRIERFTMNEGGSNWREASRLLGRHLFRNEAVGDAPLRTLKGIMRDLIGSGAPADRSGLLRALRQRGHHDTGAPGFEEDVAKLRAVTDSELERLSAHGRLPLSGGVPISRESDAPLISAIRNGSLLVVGEPGAGKTGALIHAAQNLAAAGDTIVFLSVDRFTGVSIAAHLASELKLTHSVIETLEAMPGTGKKILIIDALDAARGGLSEGVFAKLIEDVHEQLAEAWSVIASIRTFDLKNGRRFQQIFPGTPADANYVEAGLPAVRHFLVPRLSETDLTTVGATCPELGSLLTSAPPPLAELLRNIFNLSLAAQLFADGAIPKAFTEISTQSELIDAYEDSRLSSTPLQQAVAAAAAVLICRRRLSVRKVLIKHTALDSAIQTGVLTESGDMVSFAHHILFDHITGRFHLEWDAPGALLGQLAGDTSVALQLAPALRFALERLWRSDSHGKPLTWQLATSIFSATSVNPVLCNVALRIAAQNIASWDDIAGLMKYVVKSPAEPALVPLLGRLTRFVEMEIAGGRAIASTRTTAWGQFAEKLLATSKQEFIDPACVLLRTLFEHGDFTDSDFLSVFGRAARALLELAWTASPPLALITIRAIPFVGKSFASDPIASRALLDRILRDPHFSQHADQEAPRLAEQILPITRIDPEFTVKIYAALFGQTITDRASTSLLKSRIMPLSSNRQQDYEHCHWQLGKAMGEVLKISPDYGTRALIEALIGKAATRRCGGHRPPKHVNLGVTTIELRGHDIVGNYRDEGEDGRTREDDVLHHYTRFLRDCDAATFAISVAAASRDYATASVWARIFSVGCERVAEVGDLLWPLIERPDFIENPGTWRDAVPFIATAWPSRTSEARIQFEKMALDDTRFTDEKGKDRWHLILGHLLALIPEDTHALEEMRSLRQALDAKGLLAEIRPTHQGIISRGFSHDFVRDELLRDGVDINAGPESEILNASDSLQAHIEHTSTNSSKPDLAALWSAAMTLLVRLETSPRLHDTLDNSAWNQVAMAVARVASSPNYVPGENGLPDLATLIATLERLLSSPYPEPRKTEESDSLGDWGVRVDAADAWMSLAARYAKELPGIIDQLEAILADPVPGVRHQVARNLHVIYSIAPDRMWAMGEQIAAHETNTLILVSFLESMRFLSHSAPERCETVLRIVKERLGAELEYALLLESFGHWTAQLLVVQGRTHLHAWLEVWVVDIERYKTLFNAFSASLRAVLFSRYALNADPKTCAMCSRAQEELAFIIRAATMVSSQSYDILKAEANTPSGEDEQGVVKQYQAAERIIHHAMNQLYFGSGAYRNGKEKPGLPEASAMKRFLTDYSEILAMLASSREPGTHHHLIQLYEFLIPGDPIAVFEAIYSLLHGRAEEEGYHYESLGSTAVVRIVQRYIADYRAIFEDEGRRARLANILQLFAKVGWPAALKLLYDLPDVLR